MKKSWNSFVNNRKRKWRKFLQGSKRQYKTIMRKHYKTVIRPMMIGLVLLLGILLGGHFQWGNLNGDNLQTTLYQAHQLKDKTKKNNSSAFFIDKSGGSQLNGKNSINKGEEVIDGNLLKDDDKNIIHQANIVIQKNILDYDSDSVEMVDEKLRCKKDDQILQWQKNSNKWKCVKSFETIFGGVASSVKINSAGALECDEDGQTLYWDDGQWNCGSININNISGDFRLNNALLDKDGEAGNAGQMLASTGDGIDWVDNSPTPFISSSPQTIGPSTTSTVVITGDNFTDSSAISIPGFDGTIDDVNVLSPNEMEITVTAGITETDYDIVISNNGILNTKWPHNGENILVVAGNTILVPGDGTTNWERISTNVATSQGKLVPTVNTSGWNKGASFGTIPAGKDFLLTFKPAYMSGYSSGGYAMIGVDVSDPNHHYNTMDYALYMQNGSNFIVYENGASKGTHGTWTTSDTLGVRRTGTTIEYLKNGTVMYTSATPSSSALVFDSSLYRYLGAENIQIEYSN